MPFRHRAHPQEPRRPRLLKEQRKREDNDRLRRLESRPPRRPH